MAYDQMRDHGPFGHLPWGIRHVFNVMVCKYCAVLLWGQGMGRHTKAEVTAMIQEAISSLNGFAESAWDKCRKTDEISKEPFWILGGPGATESDFCLYGVLVSLLATVV
jgi:hypothetical protein